jgi:hypothetical protein
MDIWNRGLPKDHRNQGDARSYTEHQDDELNSVYEVEHEDKEDLNISNESKPISKSSCLKGIRRNRNAYKPFKEDRY